MDHSLLSFADETRQELFVHLRLVAQQKLSSLTLAQSRLAIRQESAGFARQQRDIVLKSYQAGQSELTRFNETQSALIRAEANYRLDQMRVLQLIEEILAERGENLNDEQK